jgi:hypothetical protein
MAEANTRPEVIAAKLNRSVRAVKARSYMIGLPLKMVQAEGEGEMTMRFNGRGIPERAFDG